VPRRRADQPRHRLAARAAVAARAARAARTARAARAARAGVGASVVAGQQCGWLGRLERTWLGLGFSG